MTDTTTPALALADLWQRDFPLTPEPFAAIAASSALSHDETIDYLQTLRDGGILARIGATVRPNTIGASTLAAMQVPPDRLAEAARIVSSHPAVNHNYERRHAINLWFVVTAGDRSEVGETLASLSRACGADVLDLPLERAYHIDLGFRLTGSRAKSCLAADRQVSAQSDATDKALLAALEDGLDLVQRPYRALGERTGLNEDDVLARLDRLIEAGIVTRFGCILRHRRVGYRANAMAVWDVPDAQVDGLAERLARHDEVTLCYRRTRRMPAWPYNLFAMVHGREEDIVRSQIAKAAHAAGLADCPSDILFSRRCFKQSAARIAPHVRGAA